MPEKMRLLSRYTYGIKCTGTLIYYIIKDYVGTLRRDIIIHPADEILCTTQHNSEHWVQNFRKSK